MKYKCFLLIYIYQVWRAPINPAFKAPTGAAGETR
nr:MAG TPA: hypothetical protein [Caudoviricetes sp.]